MAKHREVLVVGQLLDAVGKEIARLVGYRCPDRHVRQFPGAGGERPRGPNPNSKARRPRQRTKVLTEGEALERLREVSRIEIKSIAALGALWGWERSRTSKAVTRPHMCDQVVRPLLDQGAGGRSPGLPAVGDGVRRSRLLPPEILKPVRTP